MWIVSHWKGIGILSLLCLAGRAMKWLADMRKSWHEGSAAKEERQVLGRKEKIKQLKREILSHERKLRETGTIHTRLALLPAEQYWLEYFKNEEKELVIDALAELDNERNNGGPFRQPFP
jgi:hypothetical protein